jgi:hypothetical protein
MSDSSSDSWQVVNMTSFTATREFLGNADFKVIDIDPRQVAEGLQLYLERGSKLTGVSLEDIDRTVTELPTNVKTVTLADLINRGMKLFDAIVWLTAGRPEAYPLQKDVSKKVDNIPSLHEIARCVFYTYFFLLTQARYPVKTGGEGQPAVANFLRVVMGMDQPQGTYIEKICSFSPQKFDPAWVKFVNFGNFGQEALSRFGLGVAGYRMFGPFKIYTARADISQELRNAVMFARSIAIANPSWDVHPLTRKPEILTRRGNLNKNLGNLILEVFTEEQINEMVKSKMLYKKPDKEPNYQNYLTWTVDDDITGTAFIFRS